MNPSKDCCDEARNLSVENMKMSLELGKEAEEIDRMQGKIWQLEAEIAKYKAVICELPGSLSYLKAAVRAMGDYGEPQFDDDNIWDSQSWRDVVWQAKEEIRKIEESIAHCQGECDG